MNSVAYLPTHSGPGSTWKIFDLEKRRIVNKVHTGLKLENTDFLKLITLRLTGLTFRDLQFPNVDLDFLSADPNVGFSLSYTLGNEKLGSFNAECKQRQDKLSHILVVSPEQDYAVQNPDVGSPLIRFGESVFPKGEKSLLHPARVQCFVKVGYILKRKGMSGRDALLKHETSCLVKRESHFALVDYYEPHLLRNTWRFANVAEAWSSQLPFLSSSRYPSQNLVSVDHIAGKFVPGIFELYQRGKDKELVNFIDKTPSPAMAVIRMGIRDPLIC